MPANKKLDWTKPLASGQSPEEILEDLYFEGGYTDDEITALLSVMAGREVSKDSVKWKRQKMGLGKGFSGVPLVGRSTAVQYDEIPNVDGDTVVMCDIHIPYHDAGWCNRVISLSHLWGVKNLILGGDILDLSALKAFFPFFVEGQRKNVQDLETEFEDAGRFFDALAGFERILYISGGHELRLLRKLESPIAVRRFAQMFTDLPQLEMSAYHKAEIGKDWHISHPRNTSVIPGRVPFFLVRKHRKNCAIGHDHVWGMVQDESGENVAVSIGVCCDPKRLDYVALQDTTRPEVSQGALIIKGGKPWLLSPKWTDFRALRTIKWNRGK